MSKEKRILYVIGTYGRGGSELQLLKLLQQIKKTTDLKPELYFCNCFGDEKIKLKFEQLNIPIHGRFFGIDDQSNSNFSLALFYNRITNNLTRLHDLIKIVLGNKITKIQSFLPAANFLATLTGALTFTDVYTGWRGLPSDGSKPNFFSSFLNSFSNLFSKKIIANSSKIIEAKEKYEWFVNKNKVSIIANIYEEPEFNQDALVFADNYFKNNKLLNKVNVLTIANIKFIKGQDLAIEAMALLPDNFHYLMIGGFQNEEYEKELKDKILKLALNERVHFIGLQNQEVCLQFLKKCDVYLSPSRSEGLSNSILEALMWGKKIVASDVGGASELLEDGQYGYLFDSGDISQLSALLSRAVSNDSLISNKRIYFEKKYSGSSAVDKYLKEWDF